MSSNMPRLNTDLLKIIKNTIDNRLDQIKIKWKKEKSMVIVLCSKGYPGNYKKNKIINNVDKVNLSKNHFIFHAGTKRKKELLLSNGGRVLNIASTGNNFLAIRKKIISIIKKINWKNGFYRKDIGWKVIR